LNIYLLDILAFPERLLYSPNCHPAESAIFYQAYCTLKLEEHMKERIAIIHSQNFSTNMTI